MRRIKMDLGELMVIFDDASWETSHYLDLETGQVVMITDETRWELERIYEEHDPEEQPFDLAEILQQRDLPEWQRRTLLEADQVEAQHGARYIGVPQADSHEGYRDMERFIVTVEDERLQDQLWRAISGRGAFRYFKDVLATHFHERERCEADDLALAQGERLAGRLSRASSHPARAQWQHPSGASREIGS
jgi:hypothetical protein